MQALARAPRGVARLANGTAIGFSSRLVSDAFGNNVIRPPNENTPWVVPGAFSEKARIAAGPNCTCDGRIESAALTMMLRGYRGDDSGMSIEALAKSSG